jgi:hypothetical protein
VPNPVVLIDKLDGTGQRALKQPRKLRGIAVRIKFRNGFG